ncbi:bifunctional Peptide chain release factor class I/Peptide chain release factor class I superfamily [Babesia duncani]|uniref:Bifunctional Peptide chain release factor class I/Peptide chain release factor class I superfamily n=1 Tax=Babesia duncani TaxID=323732 RepID=A0AAD9PLW7_9APIC|nr:bifunctional Peptide chain release factor class I/Peptide chain release factor class I superfamily [Babesia duncani]
MVISQCLFVAGFILLELVNVKLTHAFCLFAKYDTFDILASNTHFIYYWKCKLKSLSAIMNLAINDDSSEKPWVTKSKHKDEELSILRQELLRKYPPAHPLKENYVKARGPGGQKINKTSICVQLLYMSPLTPAPIVIKCSKNRSLIDNRIEATKILMKRLEYYESREEIERHKEELKESRRILHLSTRDKERKKFEKQLRSEKKLRRRKIRNETFPFDD